ncbi:MAG: GC-type dockerin domain-anchored protein [Phycisphaerales bacterium]
MKRLAVIVICCANVAAGQTWRSIGPSRITEFGGSTGRVAAVACVPGDSTTFYIGAADGGVWKTTDAGATWRSLTDDFPTPIGALAIDPANTAVVYAGSGEANFANHSRPGVGIYKSTDGGETWSMLGGEHFAGRSISRISIDPAQSRRLLVAVTGAGGFPLLAAAKGHPLANGPRGLWKSDDAGSSWFRIGAVPDLDVTDVVRAPDNSGVILAGVGRITGDLSNGVWRSADNGVTWARIVTGLPVAAETGRIGLAASPARPGRFYAFIARPCDATGGGATTRGVYRSDDGGVTWAQVHTGSYQSTYGWYFATITAHPTNPDEVWIGGLEALRSVNAGVTFLASNVPHPDVHALVWDGAGRLISGDDGGVHRWQAGAWSTLNHGLTLTQCYAGLSTHPTDPAKILVGLQDNGSALRESETSTVWRSVYGGDGGWTQVDQTDPSRMFVEAQGTGNLGRSINGSGFVDVGAGLSGRNCFLPPYLLVPGVAGRMLYGTERLWVSTNSGDTFTVLSADLAGGTGAIRSLAIAPSDPRFVYVSTNTGFVLVSQNGGATFSTSITGHPGWPRCTREIFVSPDDPRTAYVAAAGYGSSRVLMTTSAGATWSVIGGGLPDLPVNTVAADVRFSPHRVFAGMETGVWVQEGQVWRPYGRGMPKVPTIDLLVEPGRNRLIAATQGRGVFTAPLCLADFTNDGAVDADDTIAFFAAWDVSAPAADMNGDGGVDGDDVILFFARWDGGC